MPIQLSSKDLCTVAIYSVLFFTTMLIVGWLGFIPIFIPLLAVLSPLLGALPFMLFLTRVDKFGMVTLLGLVNGLLMMVTGMGPWVIVTGVIFGYLADWLLLQKGYRNYRMSLIAYGIFSLWVIGNFLPFYLSRESYFAMLANGYSEEYAQSLRQLLPMWLLPILVLAAMVFGYIGAKLSMRVLRVQLTRAGIR